MTSDYVACFVARVSNGTNMFSKRNNTALSNILSSSFLRKQKAHRHFLKPKCQLKRTRTHLQMSFSSDNSSDSDLEDLALKIKQYISESAGVEKDGLLSLEMLRLAGRTDIIAGIVKCGGSSAISQYMDLDISLFLPPLNAAQPKDPFPNFYQSGTGASIALGRDLDARLDNIDNVDVNNAQTTGIKRNRSSRKPTVPSAEELKRQNEAILPPIVDDVIPAEETLAMPPILRLTTVVSAAVLALGYGRVSHEIISMQIENIFKALANGLTLGNLALALYVSTVAAPRLGRDPFVWFVKTLLSGAVCVRYLRSFGPLNSTSRP